MYFYPQKQKLEHQNSTTHPQHRDTTKSKTWEQDMTNKCTIIGTKYDTYNYRKPLFIFSIQIKYKIYGKYWPNQSDCLSHLCSEVRRIHQLECLIIVVSAVIHDHEVSDSQLPFISRIVVSAVYWMLLIAIQ